MSTPNELEERLVATTPQMELPALEDEAASAAPSPAHTVVDPHPASSPTTSSRHPSIIYDEEGDRETFGKRMEFILTTVGYAVGLGNVWRFPYLCYENGGGTFLVPYVLSLIFLGVPVFLLELAVGQLFRRGAYGSLCYIDTRLRWIGYLSMVVCITVGLYYNVVIAWSIYYFFWCFRTDLEWSSEDPTKMVENAEKFFQTQALDRSTGYYDVNRFNWGMVGCLFLAWVVIFLCIRKGIKSSGKVVYVTATVPYVLLLVLFFRGITLEGAGEGIRFYLTPDFEKLLHPGVWVAAANQIFFSLGTGFGSLITYGSYNPRDENVVQDALLVPLINAFTSVFAGFGVFSILGHLAHESGVPVADVTKDGLGLAFVVYPAGLSLLPCPQLFCVCFFFMLFCLGVDSNFATVEVLLTFVKDMKVPIGQQKLAAAMSAAGFCCGLIFATDAGVYWFSWTNDWSSTFLLLIIVIGECIGVGWMYGTARFSMDFKVLCKRHIPPFFFFCIKTLVAGSKSYGGVTEPPFATALGWLLGLGPALIGVYCWRTPLDLEEATTFGSRSPNRSRSKNASPAPLEDLHDAEEAYEMQM